ncbi:alpha/beta superfamily hydrolase [Pseudohyphozyma bogoriensis]|nr:alpha/beta superfamily hydrolase [Pseudohyphozyma bogoriensis]
MLILFQRNIIYLPSIPPGTRILPLTDPSHAANLGGLEYEDVEIESEGRSTWLRRKVMLRGFAVHAAGSTKKDGRETGAPVILYLQGNAGSGPARLPVFRSLLLPPSSRSASSSTPPIPGLTVLAISPRSYWLSTRSTPTEKGVLDDYRTALRYAAARYPGRPIVLYGHSLGGAATILLSLEASSSPSSSPSTTPLPRPAAIILENPLPSIPYMVRTLYPQRWLPYYYLGPFVLDRWDAIGAVMERKEDTWRGVPRSLWIRSGEDEVVEGGGVREMFERWGGEEGEEAGKKWVEVKGALHDTAFLGKEWRGSVLEFLRDVEVDCLDAQKG